MSRPLNHIYVFFGGGRGNEGGMTFDVAIAGTSYKGLIAFSLKLIKDAR